MRTACASLLGIDSPLPRPSTGTPLGRSLQRIRDRRLEGDVDTDLRRGGRSLRPRLAPPVRKLDHLWFTWPSNGPFDERAVYESLDSPELTLVTAGNVDRPRTVRLFRVPFPVILSTLLEKFIFIHDVVTNGEHYATIAFRGDEGAGIPARGAGTPVGEARTPSQGAGSLWSAVPSVCERRDDSGRRPASLSRLWIRPFAVVAARFGGDGSRLLAFDGASSSPPAGTSRTERSVAFYP